MIEKRFFIDEVDFSSIWKTINDLADLYVSEQINCIVFLSHRVASTEIFTAMIKTFAPNAVFVSYKGLKKTIPMNVISKDKDKLLVCSIKPGMSGIKFDFDYRFIEKCLSERSCVIMNDETFTIGITKWDDLITQEEVSEANTAVQH